MERYREGRIIKPFDAFWEGEARKGRKASGEGRHVAAARCLGRVAPTAIEHCGEWRLVEGGGVLWRGAAHSGRQDTLGRAARRLWRAAQTVVKRCGEGRHIGGGGVCGEGRHIEGAKALRGVGAHMAIEHWGGGAAY